MTIRFQRKIAMWACLFFFSLVFGATSPAPTNKGTSAIFTLNQLSKIDTAVLQGSKPSYTFYIPVPSQWQVNALDLNLVIQFSPLLLNSSSLTMVIDDVPLDSIKLDKANPQPISWKVTIPKNYIGKKTTTVRLVGYMKISDEVCRDVENQGNWVTLSGNSSITYHYLVTSPGLSLMDFPYPFIHKDAPYVDKIMFFMPDKTGVSDFAPYFNLANILTQAASWRGVEFDVKKFTDFDSNALTNPSIIAALPGAVDFSAFDLPGKLQLKDKQWVQADGVPVPNDVGILWLSSRAEKPLLLISANSDKGLSTAIESIHSNMMHFTATDPSFFLAQPVSTNQLRPTQARAETTFREMGYKDSVVFGTGQNQLTYQFNLPVQYANKPVKLVLRYSHSPFLQKDRVSSMTAEINGFPMDGVELVPDSSKNETFSVVLPQKQLKLGKNTLIITFNLRLSDAFCSRDSLNQAWGTIYDNSYLQFQSSEQIERNQIKSYSDVMTGPVVVALPNDPQVYENKDLVQGMIRFAASLDQSTSITVKDNQSLKEPLGGQNLIYFGTGGDKSLALTSLKTTFTQLIHNLDVTSNNHFKSIDKSVFLKAFEKNQDIGFIGISATGPEKPSSQLTLFGYTSHELALAVGLLNNSYKLSLLTGNLAVSFQNGTFTSLSTTDIQDSVQSEVRMERISRMTVQYILYGLGALFLAILAYFGWRSWRGK